MAKLNVDKLQADFCAFLPADWVSEVARRVGAVVRERKVKISALVWTLILGFAGGSGPRTIAALRRTFEQVTGETIVASAYSRAPFSTVVAPSCCRLDELYSSWLNGAGAGASCFCSPSTIIFP